MSREIIPLFSTSASRSEGGIFTVEKAGEAAKQKRTRGPVSLCDLAKAEGLKKLYLVESNFISFFQAQKNLKAADCQLVFGLKMVICENIADKSEASLKTESKVIIWMAGDGSTDYQRLINLYTVAATDGFYYVPRLDWKTLCAGWGSDLILSLPFYSSFLAKNTLTFSTIVPEVPAGVTPLVLREVGQNLPVDGLINAAVDRYVASTGAQIQDVKSVYYRNRVDSKAWQVWRCILRRTTYDKPNDDATSQEFCWEAWKELMPRQETTT